MLDTVTNLSLLSDINMIVPASAAYLPNSNVLNPNSERPLMSVAKFEGIAADFYYVVEQ